MRKIAVAVFALFVLAPAAAAGYVPSPQYGAFEIKFGPYRPNVDEEPGIQANLVGDEPGPYESTFGGKDNMFLTTLELDWQFLRVPGVSFGVGGSFGFMQEYARALTVDTGQESSDYTVLNVMPFAVLAVIRVDVFADHLRVPLVPYFKGGFNWYLWWVLGAGETIESGGTMGWQLNPGLAFRLDSFDPMSARTFDNEAGVNHSYIFFEFLIAGVEGFGRDGYMYLSPNNMGSSTFQIGLGVEF